MRSPTEAPVPPFFEGNSSLRAQVELRQRPAGSALGHQRWSDLLFLHWEIEPADLQATLPEGLYADTFGGAAYLGIVPFRMEKVRPAFLPPVPWLSWFLELNVRTYVRDRSGRPGVWFYSLDCNQPVAVSLARRLFHLPYRHASMSAEERDGTLRYRCLMRQPGARESDFAWAPGTGAAPAVPGSLEFFLVERYLLFAADPSGRLYSGRVHHAPYQVSAPTVGQWSAEPARQAGFELAGPPSSLIAARPVEVSIYPLERVP